MNASLATGPRGAGGGGPDLWAGTEEAALDMIVDAIASQQRWSVRCRQTKRGPRLRRGAIRGP